MLPSDVSNVKNSKPEDFIKLYIAAQDGKTEDVKTLLNKNEQQKLYKLKHDNGATPLYIAAQNGHTEVVKALLSKGSKAWVEGTSTGATPLQIALQQGHWEVVKVLLQKGAMWSTKIELESYMWKRSGEQKSESQSPIYSFFARLFQPDYSHAKIKIRAARKVFELLSGNIHQEIALTDLEFQALQNGRLGRLCSGPTMNIIEVLSREAAKTTSPTPQGYNK